MELVVQAVQDLREELRSTNSRVDQGFQSLREELRSTKSRIDRLTLAVFGVGGGVIVALVSLVGVLAIQLIRNG